MVFAILQMPRDDKGIRSHVEQYKAFRLHSLQTAPEAFGSTYSREVAFTDDVWYNRLANPEAVTFIAMHGERIVSSLTAIGPLTFGPEELSASGDPWKASSPDVSPQETTPQHYRINGMFTLPELRGQGIAEALLRRAIQHGIEEAAASGRRYVASIVVDTDNPAARALYDKCGFAHVREDSFNGTSRRIILLKYTPTLTDSVR